MNHELWFTKVFHHHIQGNITPVLISNENILPETCQQIATKLGMSDTAFLLSSSNHASPLLLSFSPYEELRFCTQTLLATACVLHAKHGRNSHYLLTKNGTVHLNAEKENIWWVSTQLQPTQEASDFLSQLKYLNISAECIQGDAYVTGVGRQRLYIPIKSSEELHQIQLGRKQVMTFCTNYNLTGICLFVIHDSHKIEQRVFTTSLGGAEDAATGGAALGLLCCSRLRDCKNLKILVEQGQLETTQRGHLFIRVSHQAGYGEIGGRVEILSKGNFARSEGMPGYM